MRKKLIALFCMVLWMTQLPSAWAAGISPLTEQGQEGSITYISLADENLDAWLQARLDMDDALILLRSGAEITGTTDVFQFEKDGIEYASVRFTQQGKIRFGRYGQTVSTVLLDMTNGGEAALESVLGDLESLEAFLDLYVEEKVLPSINTYLDVSELLPVPLENVYLAQDGLTIHYPADRFSFFSGNSGAVEIKYYELAEVLPLQSGVAPDAAQLMMTAAAKGMLPGVADVWLDMTLSGALAVFGTITDPDYIADGEIYELERPSLRGVQLIAPMDAQMDAQCQLTGIRSQRVNMCGLMTGVTEKTTGRQTLGEPAASVQIDAAAAESYRVAEGSVDIYQAGDYQLKMYYDTNDILFAAEISR
ncbi:MAG: hypothetical protein IJA59_07585 [Clostridia bacterium]|nr:hypothetical protein [Clostridia bacterium]